MKSCITAGSYISAQDCYRSAARESAKEEGEGLLASREAEEEMARLNAQFEKFWAQHGEMLVWKLWVQKYPDQVHYHQLAPMPAVQEVEVGGEVECRPAEGAVTLDKRHGEGEGGNSGMDGHSGESGNGGEGRHSGESGNGGEGRHSGESGNGGEGRHSGESGNGGEGRHSGESGNGGEGRHSAGGGNGGEGRHSGESGNGGEGRHSGGGGNGGEGRHSGGGGSGGEGRHSGGGGNGGEGRHSGGGGNGGEGRHSGGGGSGGEGRHSGGGGNGGEGRHSGESGNGGEGRHSAGGGNGGEGRHSAGGGNGGEGRHSAGGGNGGEGRHSAGGGNGGEGRHSAGGGNGGEGRHSAGGGTGSDCKGVPVADVSAQDTLVASKRSMDASGDAHIHALGLKLEASLGSAVDASGDASAAQPLKRGRVLSNTLPPGGEVPHGSVTHQGVSTQSHLSGTFPACVGEVSVGDVEDNTQPCPGEKSQSDTTVEVAVKCELEGNIPTTHLTGFNLAIHSTMSRVREDLSSGLTSDQKKDTCVEGSTGYAVGGTETSMVHMMHTYASTDGGSRGERHRERDEDEAGDDSDGSPVRRLCIITFNIYCVAFNIYILLLTLFLIYQSKRYWLVFCMQGDSA